MGQLLTVLQEPPYPSFTWGQLLEVLKQKCRQLGVTITSTRQFRRDVQHAEQEITEVVTMKQGVSRPFYSFLGRSTAPKPPPQYPGETAAARDTRRKQELDEFNNELLQAKTKTEATREERSKVQSEAQRALHDGPQGLEVREQEEGQPGKKQAEEQ